jgi:hypothetical protein
MKKGIFVILLLLTLAACGCKKSNSTANLIFIPLPGSATLSAPAQNEVCATGTIISATQSSITFSWNASANTESYDLVLKNLLTSTTATQNTTATQLTLTLLRNTPYSWYIVSKSSKTTAIAQSDLWKFYNSGPGVVTYAPFPADITSPTYGQGVSTATVDLKWTGSVVSPDVIAGYDVYFGTGSSPALLKSAITDSFVNAVNVTSGTTYYWKVITKDVNGNTSDSGVYQFSVN